MNEFVIKEISNTDIESELLNIGFDNSYAHIGKDKFEYKNLKIFGLTPTQANILKQSALSVGADCATHKEVITSSIPSSNVILGGNISQLKKISRKLKAQPFGLKNISESILNELNKQISKTKIVGILNITENSFSDGGEFLTPDKATEHLKNLFLQGADIVDIGAESTKPNAEAVSAEVQLQRILPILKNNNSQISIDTRSSVVAEKCLAQGVKIINDVSGLKYDSNMAGIIANYDATVVIQHSVNQQNQGSNIKPYNHIIDEVYLDLEKQIKYAKSVGINNIIVDVGIGFDKTAVDNWALINNIKDFKSLGYPIMLGISRKSFIDVPKEEKDIYTLAINALAINNNVDYIRVHNVELHRKLIELIK